MVSVLPLACLIGFILCQGLTFAQLSLRKDPSSVEKDKGMKLTCTYSGTESVNVISWFIVGTPNSNMGDILLLTTPCSGTVDATKYNYTCGTKEVLWTIKSVQESEDGQEWFCRASITSGTVDSDPITVVIAATCTCDNKDAICECKTGMIVFTVVNYVLDIVYFGIMVWLTLGIRALAKYAPQGNLKSVVIGCATSATIFLDIGLTINLFLNVESAEECCCTNGSNCGEGLRVALAVVGWLLSCPGFVLLIRHIAKGGCGGRGGSG